MQLLLVRIFSLSVFLLFCGMTASVNAEEYNQFKLDLILAKRGDAGAQFYVASAYEEGQGVSKDLGKAFEWYSQAAKNRHSGAQFKLGEFYENGWGVKADKNKALSWYKAAEKNGSRLAKERLKKLDTNKQAELAAKAKKEAERKRHLASEKAEKERRKKAAQAKREKEARKARERARKKKLAKAKTTAVAAVPATSKKSASPKKKKLSEKEKAAARAKYMDALLKNKWHSRSVAAEVLPSALNSCLRSSESEVVCFSREQQTTMGTSQLTFTTKSVINGFKYYGDFTVSYYFNVLDIRDAPSAASASEFLGLRAEKGWQEPQQSMKCNIRNSRQLKCKRKGKIFYFQP